MHEFIDESWVPLLVLSPSILVVIGQLIVDLVPRNSYTRLNVYVCLAWISLVLACASALWLLVQLQAAYRAKYPPEWVAGSKINDVGELFYPTLSGLLAAVVALLCWGISALVLFLQERHEAASRG